MGNLAASLPIATHGFETARFADEILIDRLNAAPGEITLVAISPLTNLASAESKCPGILQKAKELVIMGGAFHCGGNVTPQAEFNVWFNPAAAAIVIQSRDETVILPLDVTTRLRFTPQMVDRITGTLTPSRFATFLTNLCAFMVSTALNYRETQGIPAFLVHDAAAIAYLFYPELFQFTRATVQIETQGTWTRGQTLIGDRRIAHRDANSWVALQVDTALFFTHLIEDLKRWLPSA